MATARKDRAEWRSEQFGAAALDEFRRSATLSDVQVVIGERTFSCHRVILASQSLYFRGMFTGEMRESREQQVRIDAEVLSPDTFERILNHVYGSEHFQLSAENVTEIFYAADFLQVRYYVYVLLD